MEKENFKKFVISLYKPVKGLTVVMILSMIVSQILDLVKQYIIKGIIDLPSMKNFQIVDLYKVVFTLLVVIVLELIFFYISNITRTIHMVKKQTPYISEKLFNNLNKKTYSFFTDNYTGKISTAINEINNEITNLNTQITTKFISLLTSMISSLIVLYTININIFIVATILFAGIIVSRLIYFSKKYLPSIKKAEEYNREYNGILNDAVLNFTSLRLYNAVEKFSKNLKLKKQTTFTGSIQDFMYNPVKNLMILDGAITAERLAESRNKQELLGYTIKEGSVWLFMYFASKPIQKFLENAAEKNKEKPASIDLDARVIESKELKEAFENGKLVESSKKVLSLKNHEELLDFMHNNPDDFVVQMAKKSDILPTLKNATQNDDIDYRKYIDFDEFKGVAEKLDKLKNKFEEFKQANVKEKTLDAFLDNVKKLKRRSILKNMGACIGALGILAPALMIAFRKFDKDNNAFQVKEDLKKELQAKGKI